MTRKEARRYARRIGPGGGERERIVREAEEAHRAALRYADELTDEEDARLAAESAPDARPWTDELWARVRPARDAVTRTGCV